MVSRPHRTAMDLIIVNGLRKAYGKNRLAVDEVSFSVTAGEIFGLLGPNGAGKSTIVRILTTLTKADAGSASIAGHDVVRAARQVRRSIGYVAQNPGVDRWATGRENLTLQAQLQHMSAKAVRQRAEELLGWVQLKDAADRLVNTYSGGMKRRLDIAMGLVHQPGVLFLDEPTTGLDPETRRTLLADLRRLRENRQLTVFLTTHYLEEADQLCDRDAIMDQGRIVTIGRPTELKRALGAAVVEIRVAGVPEAALATLRSVPGVVEANLNGSKIGARIADATTIVPPLMAALTRAGHDVLSLSVSQPTLDDVYLHHTGHRLADEASVRT